LKQRSLSAKQKEQKLSGPMRFSAGQTLQREYPHSELIPYTLFFTANAYNQIGEFNRSADSFKTLVERFPESPLFLEANLKLAMFILCEIVFSDALPY